MSVLARLRSASKLDVLDLAEEIRAEATRLVFIENWEYIPYIPKAA